MEDRQSQLRKILLIGRLGKSHGLSGELRLFPLTSNPDRFNQLFDCLLVSPDEKTHRDIELEKVRRGAGHLVVKIRGVDSREAAAVLTGSFLAVTRDRAIELGEDEWFVCDLEGCDVYDENKGYLGKVAAVLQNGAQDVYVVRRPGSKDLLIPAVKAILRKVDINAARIDVSLPEGLFEIYRNGD